MRYKAWNNLAWGLTRAADQFKFTAAVFIFNTLLMSDQKLENLSCWFLWKLLSPCHREAKNIDKKIYIIWLIVFFSPLNLLKCSSLSLFCLSDMFTKSMQSCSRTLIPFTLEPFPTLWASLVWTAPSMPPFQSTKWVRCSCMIYIRYCKVSLQVNRDFYLQEENWFLTFVVPDLSQETTVKISHFSPLMMWIVLLIKSSSWNTHRLLIWKVR